MFIIAIIRLNYNILALSQFIFNLAIVIGILYYIFVYIGKYNIKKDVETDFTIFDAGFNKINEIKINEEDHKTWLIPWFFGGLIAMSFFFTQVTTASLDSIQKQIDKGNVSVYFNKESYKLS